MKSLKQERDQLTQQLEVNENSSVSTAPATVQSSPGQWLTVSEAYQLAAARSLNKSDVTFRRWLKNAIAAGSMPEELSSLGLVADFDARRSGNPNSNTTRWLRFEE